MNQTKTIYPTLEVVDLINQIIAEIVADVDNHFAIAIAQVHKHQIVLFVKDLNQPTVNLTDYKISFSDYLDHEDDRHYVIQIELDLPSKIEGCHLVYQTTGLNQTILTEIIQLTTKVQAVTLYNPH